MGRWDSSNRRSRLPANWQALRLQVLKRDGCRCTWVETLEGRQKATCGVTEGLEVDHIVPGDNHALENLRTLCHEHHARKTSAEGRKASAKNRAKVKKKFRRSENREIPKGDGTPLWAKWSA